jgi:hypothetical protein
MWSIRYIHTHTYREKKKDWIMAKYESVIKEERGIWILMDKHTHTYTLSLHLSVEYEHIFKRFCWLWRVVLQRNWQSRHQVVVPLKPLWIQKAQLLLKRRVEQLLQPQKGPENPKPSDPKITKDRESEYTASRSLRKWSPEHLRRLLSFIAFFLIHYSLSFFRFVA